VLVASGRAHVTGVATMLHLVILIVAIIPLSRRWGIMGAAVADLVGVAVLTTALLVSTPFFRKILVREFLLSVLAPIGAALTGGVATWLALSSVADGPLKIATESLLLLLGYGITLTLFGGGRALADLCRLLREVVLRVSMVPAPHA
jgi:O-antigen/teichoic acid export membrane protein